MFQVAAVQPNYAPQPHLYVMHYGQPAPPLQTSTANQTTVITTAPANMGSNISFGIGGVNRSINVNDLT